ncbi:MAG: hypothetical protein QM778_26425 [Myxococcales bacterium]
MNSEPRLLQDGATETERELLRAGWLEEPPPEGRARLNLALGLASTAFVSGVEAGGASGVPALGGAPSASPSAAGAAAGGVGTASLAPVVGTKVSSILLAVVAAGLGLAGAIYGQRAISVPSAVQPSAPQGVLPSSVAAPSSSPVQGEYAPVSSPLPASGLTREIALLDRARTHLAQGNAGAALAALTEHARSFPRGTLREEAMVLEIEALSSIEPEAARVAARRFLQLYPGSAHSARVRSLTRALGR